MSTSALAEYINGRVEAINAQKAASMPSGKLKKAFAASEVLQDAEPLPSVTKEAAFEVMQRLAEISPNYTALLRTLHSIARYPSSAGNVSLTDCKELRNRQLLVSAGSNNGTLGDTYPAIHPKIAAVAAAAIVNSPSGLFVEIDPEALRLYREAVREQVEGPVVGDENTQDQTRWTGRVGKASGSKEECKAANDL